MLGIFASKQCSFTVRLIRWIDVKITSFVNSVFGFFNVYLITPFQSDTQKVVCLCFAKMKMKIWSEMKTNLLSNWCQTHSHLCSTQLPLIPVKREEFTIYIRYRCTKKKHKERNLEVILLLPNMESSLFFVLCFF